jgi:hypothetical protein
MLAVKDNKTPLIDRLIELGSDVCARNNVSFNSFFFQEFRLGGFSRKMEVISKITN